MRPTSERFSLGCAPRPRRGALVGGVGVDGSWVQHLSRTRLMTVAIGPDGSRYSASVPLGRSEMAEFGSSELPKPILAVLICRIRLYCDAIADRLACEPGIALVGTANPEDNLVAEIETAAPDVVLLDTSPRESL